jgi:hypothetical protein
MFLTILAHTTWRHKKTSSSKGTQIRHFFGFVHTSSSKWNFQYFPFLLNWCSWMTTFSNLKTYLSLALKHHFGCHFKNLWKKTEYYCNISVRSINGTVKNHFDLKFYLSHIFILFLPQVGTLCRIFYHER